MTRPSTTRTERRYLQRKRPWGISYFQFEAGNGGIVLDASEKGLAFQVADAIRELGRSRICISPCPEESIELTGDIVWIDKSRKTGGLRFLDQGAETAKKLRRWLRQSSGPGACQEVEEVPLPAWAGGATHEGVSKGRQVNEKPASSSSMGGPPLKKEASKRPVAAPGPARPAVPPAFASDRTWQEAPSSSGRFLRNVATGFLIGVSVLAPVVLFEDFHLVETLRSKIADSLIRLGEKLNENASLGTPASGSAASPAPVPEPSPFRSERTANAPPAETREDAREPGRSGQDRLQPTDLGTPSTKKPAKHSPEYRNPHFTQDRSAEAARLWAAVASGASWAEVKLAGLYLNGEGVPRNCEQARILLLAAVKGGNREARQQLQKLGSLGCR